MDKEPPDKTGWSFTLEDGWTPPPLFSDDPAVNLEILAQLEDWQELGIAPGSVSSPVNPFK